MACNCVTITINGCSSETSGNYAEVTTTLGQTVLTFDRNIPASSSSYRSHQLFRNGKLEAEGIDYTISDNATGEITYNYALEASELVQLYML